MTATASLRTTETVVQRPHGVIRIDSSVKEYENWYVAKQALDEGLILWLTTLEGGKYKLSARQEFYKFEVADDARKDRTRYVEVQLVLNV